MYWGNHTFLGIVKYELYNSNKNERYLKSGINKNFIDVIKEIDSLNVDHKGTEIRTVRGSAINRLMAGDIDKGFIGIDDYNKQDFEMTEQILDYMFTSLYSDIQRVFIK